MSLTADEIAPLEPSKRSLCTTSIGDSITYPVKGKHSLAIQFDPQAGITAWGAAEITLTVSLNGINFYAPPFPYSYSWTTEGCKFVTVAGFMFAKLAVTVVNAGVMPVVVTVSGTNEAID